MTPVLYSYRRHLQDLFHRFNRLNKNRISDFIHVCAWRSSHHLSRCLDSSSAARLFWSCQLLDVFSLPTSISGSFLVAVSLVSYLFALWTIKSSWRIPGETSRQKDVSSFTTLCFIAAQTVWNRTSLLPWLHNNWQTSWRSRQSYFDNGGSAFIHHSVSSADVQDGPFNTFH